MSEPRFGPGLTPDTTRSGRATRTPPAASTTQVAGVASRWYAATAPRRTRATAECGSRSRRTVNAALEALRSSLGASTDTSYVGAKARTRAWRPSLSIPSSLVIKTRTRLPSSAFRLLHCALRSLSSRRRAGGRLHEDRGSRASAAGTAYRHPHLVEFIMRAVPTGTGGGTLRGGEEST